MKTVPLHGIHAVGRIALVDDADYDLVMQYRWNVCPNSQRGNPARTWYARTTFTENGRRVYRKMHNLIMGTTGIDHKDHDGLNNQRSNLRVASNQQNSRNRRQRFGSSSRFKGVYWVKRNRKWMARVKVNGEWRYLGLFDKEEDAALAYNAVAIKAFGEFACLNEVDASAGAA